MQAPSFKKDMNKLIYNAVAVAKIADNAAVTPATDLYVSLHTTDPLGSVSPTQSVNEIAYTGYARQAVPRTALGWTVADDGSVTPAEAIEFPVVAGMSNAQQVTYFAVGTDVSGAAGKIISSGQLNPAFNMVNGFVPRIDNQVASRIVGNWA